MQQRHGSLQWCLPPCCLPYMLPQLLIPSPHVAPAPPRYTVEFGVVREGGDVKAFGAGVLSSFGELQHMAAGKAELVPLDVSAPLPRMSYKCANNQACCWLLGTKLGKLLCQQGS